MNSKTFHSSMALCQPISFGWVLQRQKTVKPKRIAVERRATGGERRLNLRAYFGPYLWNRRMRTCMYGGVAGKGGSPLPLCRFLRLYWRICAAARVKVPCPFGTSGHLKVQQNGSS